MCLLYHRINFRARAEVFCYAVNAHVLRSELLILSPCIKITFVEKNEILLLYIILLAEYVHVFFRHTYIFLEVAAHSSFPEPWKIEGLSSEACIFSMGQYKFQCLANTGIVYLNYAQ